jgi:hypothetical protein
MRTFLLAGLLLALGLPFGGCVLPTTSSGSDAGAGAKIDTGAPTTTGAVSGTGCGTDPTSGVTLCTGTTECPSVTFDPSVFPECGFYISGDALDLECICAGYLCPMGAATTCAAAASLLQTTNEGTVCSAVSNNGCSQLPMSGAGGSGGGGGGGGAEAGTPASGCDPSCSSMCAGEPDCIQLCGC